MSRKPSRNAPCPCGSGVKYKKCCLARDDEARVAAAEEQRNQPKPYFIIDFDPDGWDDDDDDGEDDDEREWICADCGESLFGDDTQADFRWSAVFEACEGASPDDVLALAHSTLDDDSLPGCEHLSGLVLFAIDTLAGRGRRSDIAALVERFAQAHPSLFARLEGRFHCWLIREAIAEDVADIDASLERLIAISAEAPTALVLVIHALMYAGRADDARRACHDALRRARTGETESPASEYMERLYVLLSLEAHWAARGAWDAEAFAAEVAPIVDAASYAVVCQESLRQRSPTSRDSITREHIDAAVESRDMARVWVALQQQFEDALHTDHGWPRSRAILANNVLFAFWVWKLRESAPAVWGQLRHRQQRRAGCSDSGVGPPLWLLSEEVSASEYLEDQVNCDIYQEVSMLCALPRWWQFLAGLGIIEDELARERCEELVTELEFELSDFLDETFDPYLGRALLDDSILGPLLGDAADSLADEATGDAFDD